MHLKEKICGLTTIFQTAGLVFTFTNINSKDKKALEKELDCVFIRIKPDEKN